MPFAYYARLSRAQRAVYDKSNQLTEVRLARPAALHPLVTALDAALKTEDRLATQQATDRLVRGLTDAMLLPPVKVEVLAARPHARWGELHGLYTAERGKPPKIQLWMRTAKQKRVVAFRTYLRTLLHEVGHHLDFAGLRLPDSFHTEGFYKRESSLFYQLVPEVKLATAAPGTALRGTRDQYLTWPRADHLARMARTADDLARAFDGRSELQIARRPAPEAWSAKEVLCHLPDAEEYLMLRVEMSLAHDDPVFPSGDADRWAEERQYKRYDLDTALATFRRRRADTLALFDRLTPEQWERSGVSRARGRMTVADHLAVLAWHDDNHLEQLTRALEGNP
jgi:hypothetical protein